MECWDWGWIDSMGVWFAWLIESHRIVVQRPTQSSSYIVQVESHVAWNERHRGEAERAQREVMEVYQWALAGV